MIEISGEITRSDPLLARNLKLEARSGGEGELGFVGLSIPGAKVRYEIQHEVMENHGVRYYLCKSKKFDEPAEEKYFFCAIARASKESPLLNAWITLLQATSDARDVSDLRDTGNLGILNAWKLGDAERALEVWRRGLELDDAMLTPEQAANGTQDAHFEKLFPRVVERMILNDIWDERIKWQAMILDISQDYDEMVLLARIPQRGYRVDLRTSAWIVNKMLQFVAFYPHHKLGIRNFLIGLERHELVYLDWSQSFVSERKDFHYCLRNICEVARIAMQLIGATLNESGQYDYPYEVAPNEKDYMGVLMSLLNLSSDNMYYTVVWGTQKRFYEQIINIWGKEYYPSRLYPIDPKSSELGSVLTE